jgi:hypothetical protein
VLLHRHEPRATGRCPKLVQLDSRLASARQVTVKPRVVRLAMPGEPLGERVVVPIAHDLFLEREVRRDVGEDLAEEGFDTLA